MQGKENEDTSKSWWWTKQTKQYLHVASVEHQPTTDDINYCPSYKVKEFQDMLESRYKNLYIPSQNLSLDESLIRAFGRMKFKVRIVTKAARYGIKLYVITDATSAFVLKVIIYTGKTTYTPSEKEDEKKTVMVVKELCKDYAGTHRTIFVDRFYTSMDLLKALDKMGLYVTGTVMRNRLPKELQIFKTTKMFKQMNRGDFESHLYKYQTDNGEVKNYGMVAWKDRDIVYAMSSAANNYKMDECTRRSANGLIKLKRPIIISEYNTYMGGVDLADMRRLHCNSTIMGQHRWWLKLFFYLLDVGTSNSVVLFREATGNKMNLSEFKTELVRKLLGERICKPAISLDTPEVHVLVKAGDHRHL